ncbi:MAG TPA: uroporphyrinogen decarboxylase family protein [Armatimonadota bacterium]|nr:uroporphyrinogen decarboxylase family protein [Armatimonadota bacterium]HPP74484.1 uroporphyrinogen decarboxylase family protein [Armatimonadota bacterium]
MTPKERAIAAFKLQEPDDIVPTFELQFQLSEELLGRKHLTQQELDQASPTERDRLLHENAELYVAEAERLDYSIVSVTYGPSKPEDLAKTVSLVKQMVGNDRLVAVGSDGTLAIPSGQTMMDLVGQIMDSPDEFRKRLDRGVDASLNYIRPLRDAGAEVVLMWSDYCFNTGPFLSPEMFSQFVTPYLARQTEGFHEMGMYAIKHTDGNIMPVLDQIISTKPDALHSIDPQGGMDLGEVKRLIGDKVALCGNVHCGMLHSGTVEEVIEDSKRALAQGKPGGGFFFTTSNTPFIGMPLQNYLAMLDVRMKYGKY